MATGRIPINGTAAIQSTIVDAKGDLIAATGVGAYIAKWEYSEPIPDGLTLGKPTA